MCHTSFFTIFRAQCNSTGQAADSGDWTQTLGSIWFSKSAVTFKQTRFWTFRVYSHDGGIMLDHNLGRKGGTRTKKVCFPSYTQGVDTCNLIWESQFHFLSLVQGLENYNLTFESHVYLQSSRHGLDTCN